MSHETESGFGSGLRAQLSKKQEQDHEQAAVEEAVAATVDVEVPFAVAEPIADVVPLISEPAVDEESLALAEVRSELEAALERERQLREALQHQVEAYERELDTGRELAVREAEADQRSARLEQLRADIDEQQLLVKIQRDQFEAERAEFAAMRETLVAEQARVTELASHIDSRSVQLESADQERAQAAAHIAQQLAALAERERELKRERASIDSMRQDHETRLAARENALRELDAATLRRQQSVAEREVGLKGTLADIDRERVRLQERAEAVAAREAAAEKRVGAREQMLENGEAALSAWEARLRDQAERLDRERNGHSHASQEAFALLAELEQREQRVSAREAKLFESEERYAEHTGELKRTEDELRLREARLLADVELREDKLDKRERNITEREELIEFRERDLTAYVGEIQGRFSDVA